MLIIKDLYYEKELYNLMLFVKRLNLLIRKIMVMIHLKNNYHDKNS